MFTCPEKRPRKETQKNFSVLKISLVGGVNPLSLHCRLTRFRGLTIRVKYGAVIGLKEPIAWKFIMGTDKKRAFGPITAPYLTPYIKPRKFAKR